ncbi:S-layer homology domain-containing protein [Agathobaculum sp.]|uniref:S-layer homology domain-containing protein n=1 Tax=Agathobaculum sp. TaxID=2048138 RepID=UPI003AB151EC
MKYKGGVTDDEAVTPEAKIGEVSYNTLQDAFDNAESGDTVTLLKNIKTSSVDAANAGLAISKSITLDLNDKTIISPDNMGNNKKNIAALTVKADTTIKATTGGIDTGKNGGYAINVLSGAKLTIDGGKYYGGSTAVQVQTGELTIKDGYFDAEAFSGSYGYNFIINCIDSAYKDDTAKVAIKGGYFAHFNPANNKAEGAGTNFVADGYISVTSDKSGYDYMVTKKTTVGTTDVTPDVAEPEVTASKDIPSEVTEAAKNIEAPDLATAANDIVKNIGEDTVSDLVHKSGYENPNLYVQTSLKVEAKAYDATAKTLTLEITPQYRIVASTAATADGIELGDNGNAKVVQGYQPLDITKPIEVTMELPTSFAVDNGAKLSIKHTKSNGTVEYYTGTVTEQSGKHLLTFTTNGFSPFVISVPAASIGENVYPTLQAAVDSVDSGKTIKLGQAVAPDTKVTVAKTIKFEVATNEKTFAKENIVAGANTTVKVTGDARLYTYEFTYTKPSSGGSSGGSSSGKTTYKVTTSAVNNGGVNASPSNAEKGATITITLSPDKGYKLDKLTVTDGSGKTVSTVKKSDTVYTFTMPASAVKVGVSYVKATETPSETKFNDVSANDWFASAVDYVTGKGMMNGTADNTFSPKANTTRGMVVTVLYRLENQPSTSAASFTDVASGAYYANAVAWANANGIVSGYGSGKFGPNDKVTREQLAAILYRYAQYKKYDVSVGEDTNILSYDDAQSISSYAIPAIQWACGAGVVTGKSGSKLDPKGNATRAEVAAMLMRFCENVK